MNKNLTACSIEDNEIDRQILGGMLKSLDVKADMESNLTRFYEKVFESRPSVVFIDLSINSNNDGFEVIKKIKKELDSIIFVVSSATNPELITHALEIGVNEYLVKPLDFDILKLKLSKFFINYEISKQEQYKVNFNLNTTGLFKAKSEVREISKQGITFYSPHLFSKGSLIKASSPSLFDYYEENSSVFEIQTNWLERETEKYGHFAKYTTSDELRKNFGSNL